MREVLGASRGLQGPPEPFRGLQGPLAASRGLQQLQEPSDIHKRGLHKLQRRTPENPPATSIFRYFWRLTGISSSLQKPPSLQVPQEPSLGLQKPFQSCKVSDEMITEFFEGLVPHLSKDGLFGKGTYLAEDAAKIDQYLKQDLEWRGNKPDHELQKLDEVGVKQRCCCC